jgi:hypothetical protein
MDIPGSAGFLNPHLHPHTMESLDLHGSRRKTGESGGESAGRNNGAAGNSAGEKARSEHCR